MQSRARWVAGGIAALGALAALATAGEQAWVAGFPQLADLIGVSRLAVCWLWLVPAWKSLRPEADPVLARLGRTTLAAVLVFAVLT